MAAWGSSLSLSVTHKHGVWSKWFHICRAYRLHHVRSLLWSILGKRIDQPAVDTWSSFPLRRYRTTGSDTRHEDTKARRERKDEERQGCRTMPTVWLRSHQTVIEHTPTPLLGTISCVPSTAFSFGVSESLKGVRSKGGQGQESTRIRSIDDTLVDNTRAVFLCFLSFGSTEVASAIKVHWQIRLVHNMKS